MPVFGYQDAAKEIARLQRRTVDFGLLQDKIDEHRDRVPRIRRSACPSPEKQQDLKAGCQYRSANPMPGFKAINGTDKSQARASAAAQQREVPPERSTTADPAQTRPVPPAAVPHIPPTALQPDVGSPTRPRSTQKDANSQDQEQEKADGQDRQEQDEETEEDEEEQDAGSRYPTSDIVTDIDASDDERRRTPRWQLRPRTERPPGPQLTPSPSPSPEPLPLPTVQLEDRDWAVIGITDARKEYGFTEYRTIWGSTRHALPTLQANEDGIHQVEVGGRVCDIESLDRLPVLGDHTNIKVRWKCQWLMTWELSDARKEVVEFNLRRNEGVTADPDYLKSYCAPEPEARSTARCSLVHESRFKPEPTGDYTTSLMQHCAHRSKSEENSSGLSINILRGLLDELPRQRLVLRSQWRVEKNRIHTEDVIKIPRWDSFLRICMVYVVGQARKQECSFCADCGPFRKCVTKGGNFDGACVNCALLGRKQDCEYHQSRWIEADQMLQTLDKQETHDDTNDANDDALRDDEPIARSSVPRESATTRNSALLTPPTSSPNMNAQTTHELHLPDDTNINVNELADKVRAQLDGLGSDQSPLQNLSLNHERPLGCNVSAIDHKQAHVAIHASSKARDLCQDEAVIGREVYSSPVPTPAREYSVSAEALPDCKENSGPSTEQRGTKRRRSILAESMPRRQQPSRQHKAVRTLESTDCEPKNHTCNHKAPEERALEPRKHKAVCAESSSSHIALHQSSEMTAAVPAKAESTKVLVHLPARNRKTDAISQDHTKQHVHQQTDSAPSRPSPFQQEDGLLPDHVRHAACSRRGPCIDPILNPMPLKTEPELTFESVTIYSDRARPFKDGELTDAEVRYLLSLALCKEIDLFELGWTDYNEDLTEDNDQSHHQALTKERYLSCAWADELNVIMRRKCPYHPDNVDKRVVIDLTMDDDDWTLI